MVAAWLILRSPDEAKSWWTAAVLTGFAFSLHPSAILLWLPLIAGAWLFRNKLGWRMVAVCAVLPLAILGIVWLAAHRERSLEALSLFRVLNAYRTDKGFEVARWAAFFSGASLFSRGSLSMLIPIGGLSNLAMMAGWALIATQIRHARASRWVAFSLSCTVLHVLWASLSPAFWHSV